MTAPEQKQNINIAALESKAAADSFGPFLREDPFFPLEIISENDHVCSLGLV